MGPIYIALTLYFLINIALAVIIWFFVKDETKSVARYFLLMIFLGIPHAFLYVLIGSVTFAFARANNNGKNNNKTS